MRPLLKYVIIAALSVIVTLVLFKDCGHQTILATPDKEKQEVRQLKEQKKIIHSKADTVTLVQTKYVTRYKEVRHDSLIPREVKLIICDTLIQVDSTLISELRWEIGIDNEIIFHQDAIIKRDSLTITDLSKSAKRQKRRTKLVVVLAAIIAGIAVVK